MSLGTSASHSFICSHVSSATSYRAPNVFWVLFRVCAWMILLISLLNREAAEETRDRELENTGPFLVLPLTGPVVLRHVTSFSV